MTAGTEPLTELPAWKALKAHYGNIRNLHLRKLFAEDPKRGEQMSKEAAGIYLDYSKNRITAETLRLLLDLAEAVGLRARIDAMFRGEKINISEQRAVLHVALRAPRAASILVDGENVVPAVHAVLDRMADFAKPNPQRRTERPYRQADPQRREYRHWRLRSRTSDGL